MFYPVGFVKIKDPWTMNMMHNKHIGLSCLQVRTPTKRLDRGVISCTWNFLGYLSHHYNLLFAK